MKQSTTDIQELKQAVEAYASKRNGQLYAPILHPEFANFKYHHGHERFDAIRPHVPAEARTMLDIGSHWGYFAHRFEDIGLNVTAAENSKEYLFFLRSIRDVCGKKFAIWERSIFEVPEPRFDLVLALNIFHHFIKTEAIHKTFVDFLKRLDSNAMLFQPHNPAEGQMKGAYRNYEPEEFAAFVMEQAGYTIKTAISKFQGRPIYLLSK